ncbi:hypothetical protein [Dokdonia sp.]|uniref:hypothetical protein n=1 Tax=Dokdonia sp. TaxID=2024995 RepID=UPI003267988F
MNTLQNSKAVKLINKLIDDVYQNGIIINTVVDDLTTLRPYTIDEQLPLLAKATRLAAEHISEHETFSIPIPQDDPIVEGEEGEDEEAPKPAVEAVEVDPKESLHYFFCLIRDIDKKVNEDELREYVAALNAF